jgi:hypothetical protein
MQKMFDVGLIGLAGSGKDTAADFMHTHYGYTRVSFASKLKSVCKSLGWDELKNERGRKLLQDVGMAFRAYDGNTWINEIDKSLDTGLFYVFSDLRFPNEADYVRNTRKGIIIRIHRPGLNLTKTHEHVSEMGQTDVIEDYAVINNGSIFELNLSIKKVIDHHAGKISESSN